MAYKISKPLQKKIREMYGAGVSISAIARETGLNRDTVAKYAREVDDDIDIARAPAARFTDEEVELLQGLARLARLDGCQKCGLVFAVIDATPAPSHTYQVKCPKCGIATRYTDVDARRLERERKARKRRAGGG